MASCGEIPGRDGNPIPGQAENESLWPPPLALLVGGQATRLRPLTATLPKSLVDVAGEPFLAHQLRLIRAGGIREVVLCCGFCGQQIEDFAGDGNQFDLRIRYSYDGEWPLGTGGALRTALPLLGRRFLVMYGDSWLTEPIQPVWRTFLDSGKPALMTVFRNNNRWGTSNVDYHEGLVVRYERRYCCPATHYIDYGLEAMEARVLAPWTVPVFDLGDVWSGLASCRMLAGYEASSRFYEIGSVQGLRETEAVVAAAAAPVDPLSLAGGFSSVQRRARGVWSS
ncbi:MAG TPA: sugar phosphate nucleotidyltransferase [Acidobacteriaceae bacterium]|nr:sugar phosphate nucleotidyltransferase [Acidobacteriaceae bacterium]